jgi:hypothetical protein
VRETAVRILVEQSVPESTAAGNLIRLRRPHTVGMTYLAPVRWMP